jgi:hypothetical protein
MVGMGNVDDMMAKKDDQQQQGMDPKVMADMAEIQFKMVELKQKTADAQQEGQRSMCWRRRWMCSRST